MLEVDPFWTFIGFFISSPIADVFTKAKFILRNISLDKRIATVDGLDETQGEIFINRMEEIRSHIKRKADEGGRFEKVLNNFFESLERAFENFEDNKEVDTNAVLDSIICYLSEVLNKLREVNISLNTEIGMLQMLNGGYLKELKFIEDILLNTKILQLIEQRYSNLLPTSSEKLLATQTYALIARPKDAILELEKQIEVLESHLQPEHRYPLVGLYETLIFQYDVDSMKKDGIDLSNVEKLKETVFKAIKILQTAPDMADRQAALYMMIGDFNSALSIHTKNDNWNCQLCNTYYTTLLRYLLSPELNTLHIKNLAQYYEKLQQQTICKNECLASKLYYIGKTFLTKRIALSPTLVEIGQENPEFLLSYIEEILSKNEEILEEVISDPVKILSKLESFSLEMRTVLVVIAMEAIGHIPTGIYLDSSYDSELKNPVFWF